MNLGHGSLTWPLGKKAHYTAFPTISISGPQADYISPGNYDPVIPHVMAQDIFKEAKRLPPNSRMAATLRRRATRLLEAERTMEPRGRRIAWWEQPGPPRLGADPMAAGNATADAMEAESQAMVALPGGSEGSVREPGNAGVVSTAKMARRRRRALAGSRAQS